MEWTGLNIASTVLLGLGCVFALTGALGILRFPDFFSRLHAAGNSATLAPLLILLGCSLQAHDYSSDPYLMIWRLIMIALILFVTGPTATHAIAKAGYLSGLRPWGCCDPEVQESESAKPDSNVDEIRGASEEMQGD